MKITFILYVLFFANYIFAVPIGIETSPDFFKNNLESIFLIGWFVMISWITIGRAENNDRGAMLTLLTIMSIGFYFLVK